MRQELLELYAKFLIEYEIRKSATTAVNGYWGRRPDFEEFIDWLSRGHIY